MQDESDDRVIGIALRRSLIVIAIAACLAAVAYFGSRLLTAERPDTVEADVIAPRAIDAGSEPSPSPASFTDITRSSGISHVHVSGAYGESLLPETMGGGVAVLDFNDDGAVDLLFVSARPWPWRDEPASQSSLILYKGDGVGGFVDVTSSVGLQTSLFGMGAAVGDYDDDGDVDIFITAVGTNRLYRNDAGIQFVDVTDEMGAAGGDTAWSTGAAFADYDRDGDLDLFVVNYVAWSREIDLAADFQIAGIGRAYGPPDQFAGTHSYLYRNDGGRFTDVSAESGIQVDNITTGQPLGKGLSVLPADINGDGWTDFLIANDTVQNFLLLNDQGRGFMEAGVEHGVAFDNTGAATGAMGIDSALIGPSSDLVVAIGNFGNEMTSLYVLRSESMVFTDEAIVSGVGPASRRAVTFGLFFFDYDLDGRLDFLQANGHVEDQIGVVETGQTYAQPPQLFWNCGHQCQRQFVPVELGDDDLGLPLVGRGAAYADIDGDGDLDVVLTQIGAQPRLLRNDQDLGNNWIQIDVRDDTGSPAYGAAIDVVSADRRQRRRVEPTRSYLSQVDTVLAFGLGDMNRVDQITVTWPDGRMAELTDPAVNRRHRMVPPREGAE